jgi:hypothetical protein
MSKIDKNIHYKKEFLEAFKKSLGVVSTACAKAGISRQSYYNWIEEDLEFAQACKDVFSYQCDFVESKLFESINNGSDTAIIFYLKTKGADRGYKEKLQLDNNISLNKDISEAAKTFIENIKNV